MGHRHKEREDYTYVNLLLKLGVLLLGVDEIENDVECARKHEGEEERESSQVGIPLRTESSQQRGRTSDPETY